MSENVIDFLTVDPSTLPASAELDAWVAEKRMGWRPYYSSGGTLTGWHDPVIGRYRSCTEGNSDCWSPSTNHAHAGEARRKADDWWLGVRSSDDCRMMGIQCTVWPDEKTIGIGFCSFAETNGDEAKAEALATVRALVAASQAAEQAKEGNNGT